MAAPRMHDGDEWQSGTSAGMETRPLPVASSGMRSSTLRYRLSVLALVLIGGLILLDLLMLGSINWGLGALLFTLSMCFFVAALWQRNFAFLIPACILAGLSIGLPVVEVLGPVPIIWGLALGFAAMVFLGRALFNQREPWPLFPAGALFVTGVFLLIVG